MEEDARRHFAAVIHELHVIKARSMAQDAVFNALLKCWGGPRETLIAYLKQSAERIEATGLPTAAPEEALNAIRDVFALAILAAEGGPPQSP